MNVYGVIILITFLFEFNLNLFADLLNISALRSGLPEEVKDIYDPEAYRKSQEYTRVNTKFGNFESLFFLR